MKKFFLFLFVGSYLYNPHYIFSSDYVDSHKEIVRSVEHTQSHSWWDGSYMTGDWGGKRKQLIQDGINIGASYVADILGNPIGGQEQGIAFAGSFGLDMNVDIGRHTNLKGLEFFISMVARTGTNLSEKKIQNQFPVAQVYGGQNIRLNELYFKQSFLSKNLVIQGGRLNAGNYFLESELYYKFVNNAFDGNPIAVFFNSASFSAYPNATWGALLELYPYKRLLIKLAAFLANPDVSKNSYHGFNWSFHGRDGTQLITEWSWQVNQLKEDRGYPGNYRIGYFCYTDMNGEKYLGGNYHGNYGYYFLFDQMIYRHHDFKSDLGLTPFVAILFAPKDRNTFPFFISSGLVYKGLIPGRPKDYTNLGFAYGKYSPDLREAQFLAKKTHMMMPFGNQPQNFESIIELNHWFQINPWFIIVPDIQYIINPKGFGTTPNALVIGTQISIIM